MHGKQPQDAITHAYEIELKLDAKFTNYKMHGEFTACRSPLKFTTQGIIAPLDDETYIQRRLSSEESAQDNHIIEFLRQIIQWNCKSTISVLTTYMDG